MKLSEEIQTILTYSTEEAVRTGCMAVSPEHLLLGLLRQGNSDAMDFLHQMGVDTSAAKSELDARVFRREAIPFEQSGSVNLGRKASGVLNLSVLEAMKTGGDVTAMHLLAAICNSPGEWASDFLHRKGISYAVIRTILEKKKGSSSKKKLPIPEGEDISRLLDLFFPDGSRNIPS